MHAEDRARRATRRQHVQILWHLQQLLVQLRQQQTCPCLDAEKLGVVHRTLNGAVRLLLHPLRGVTAQRRRAPLLAVRALHY